MANLENSISIFDLPTDDELFLDAEEEPSDHPPRKAVRKKSSRALDEIAENPIEGVQDTTVSGRGRWLVVLVLCLCAFGMAITTFFYIARTEQDEFEATAMSVGRELVEAAEQEVLHTFSMLRTASASVLSLAEATNQTFPFVTVPNFPEITNEALKGESAKMVGLAPTVDSWSVQAIQWSEYSVANQGWIEEYRSAQNPELTPDGTIQNTIRMGNTPVDISTVVPLWQMTPVNAATTDMVNTDLLSNTQGSVSSAIVESINSQIDTVTSVAPSPVFEWFCPRCSLMISPLVSGGSGEDLSVNGIMWALLSWDDLFIHKLPDSVGDHLIEVQNDCGVRMSYAVTGPSVSFLGDGLLHNTQFDDLAVRLFPFGGSSAAICPFSVTAYPTSSFEDEYVSSAPWVYSACVVGVFFAAAAVFACYDYIVHTRQAKLLTAAQKTSAIVAEIFPKNFQKRIIEEKEQRTLQNSRSSGLAPKSELKNLIGQEDSGMNYKGKPIADLFPETTIMFADIVGFTAWSSTREPTQVFTLLEGIYAEFDHIAAKRRVFKVETIGDCYVAVVGLPDPRKDHAIVMAKFARDCLYGFKLLTKDMERELGPDTAELGIRIGLHSGPTVAGVLRGERSRFQLFGDSVNTCSRMESTGYRNRIHVSQDTADILQAFGKSHWLQMRKDRVTAKGKGEMQTYWLATGGDDDIELERGMGIEATECQTEYGGDEEHLEITEAHLGENPIQLTQKQVRLVEWNAEILCRKLEDIIARRETFGTVPDSNAQMDEMERDQRLSCFGMALNEVVEIIELPTYRAPSSDTEANPKSVGHTVAKQLLDYVQTIASLYHSNPFHNFEHASHVTMSVNKLLSRIIAPDIEVDKNRQDLKWILHDHTYGITSDPLTQFAVTLSALIHDVDHSGVPNAQLVKEHTSLASAYKNKSIAEQNSVDIAWDLLMEDCYKDLRRTIYCNKEEFCRFRQLVVNTVLATDIMDRDLGALRKDRWNKAFAEQSQLQASAKDDVNRKATIVIEHLIQASDVAHTMQHWHVYRKWNARLFREMYQAYLDGRAEKDPCENWYKGELGFFDFYIIPLAKKLKDCGVFGVSSDEYLTYAQQNRKEWEAKGAEVVAELVQSVRHLAVGTKALPHRGVEHTLSLRAQDIEAREPVPRRMSNSQDSFHLSTTMASQSNLASSQSILKLR